MWPYITTLLPSPPSMWEAGIKNWDGSFRKQTSKGHLFSLKACTVYHPHLKQGAIKSSHRWPYDIQKIFPSTSDQCWCCERETWTILFVWWPCPVIQPFWSCTFTMYKVVMSSDIPMPPDTALLSIFPGSNSSPVKGLLHFFLLTTRAVMPRH